MKEINLSNATLDSIDLSLFDKYLMQKYRIPHEESGYGFYDKSGKEHYRMLAYLSTLFDNEVILDIGTFQGGSALALSYNKNNTVVSVDVEHQVKTQTTDLSNITFLEGDILNPNKKLDTINSIISTKGLFEVEGPNTEIPLMGSELINSSNFIFYDTVHNGIVEKEFHDYLIKTNWNGICVWDDITLRWNGQPRHGMQEFWKGIDNSTKLDITKYAHWTGTGIVWYGNCKPTINFL